MHFIKSAATFLLTLAVSSALALPTLDARQALVERTYAEIQISDGEAGNANAEARAKFPIDPSTATNADLQVVKRASQLVGDAENLAFLPLGDLSDAQQNGFIKNKVLKNYLGLLALQIQQALGQNVANLETRLAGEQTKLDKNTATDKSHAGEASEGVEFDG